MRKDQEPVKQIPCNYEKDPQYRTFTATNIWGGLDGHNNVSFDLSEERFEIPLKTRINVYEDNSWDEDRIDEPEVLRIRHAGITIPINALPGIITWLQAKYVEYLARIGSADVTDNHQDAPNDNVKE